MKKKSCAPICRAQLLRMPAPWPLALAVPPLALLLVVRMLLLHLAMIRPIAIHRLLSAPWRVPYRPREPFQSIIPILLIVVHAPTIGHRP